MFVLNLLITISILVMSFYLMIRGRFFQPSLQSTNFGKVIAWLGRVGLAANIMASFSVLANQWVKLPYSYTIETIYGLAVCLILAALTHVAYNERKPLDCPDYSYVDKKTLKCKRKLFHLSYIGMLSAVFCLFMTGPYIEQRLFPVVSDVNYYNFRLFHGNNLCFDIRFTKLRDLSVDYSVFYIHNSEEKIYQQPNTINGTGEFVRINRRQFSPGDHSSSICVNLPNDSLDWTITPEVRYRTIAPWAFIQNLPSIDVKKSLNVD